MIAFRNMELKVHYVSSSVACCSWCLKILMELIPPHKEIFQFKMFKRKFVGARVTSPFLHDHTISSDFCEVPGHANYLLVYQCINLLAK
jgi:hypothetical protein